MPIIVSYDDLNALGGAALAAGTATGTAAGQESYRARQQNDTQFLMGNVFNRQNMERQFQLEGIQQAQERSFQANQADIDRNISAQQFSAGLGARAQESAADRDFRLQLEESQFSRQQLDREADLNDRLKYDEVTGKREQERDIAMLGERRKYTEMAEDDRINRDIEKVANALAVQAGGSAGAPTDPAAFRQQAAKLVYEREAKIGNFAPNQRSRQDDQGAMGLIGTLSGEWMQRGVLAVQAGGIDSIIQATQKLRGGERGPALQDVYQGIYVAAREETNPAKLIAAYNSTQDPEARRRIAAAARETGVYQYGSNQGVSGGSPADPRQTSRNAAPPQRSLQEMTDAELDELIRARQGQVTNPASRGNP